MSDSSLYLCIRRDNEDKWYCLVEEKFPVPTPPTHEERRQLRESVGEVLHVIDQILDHDEELIEKAMRQAVLATMAKVYGGDLSFPLKSVNKKIEEGVIDFLLDRREQGDDG